MPRRPEMREPRPPPPRSPRTPVETETGGPWLESGKGLSLYAAGLSARVGLTLLLYLLMVFAVQVRTPELLKMSGIVLSLATVTTGFVMLAGLARFSRQPTRGRSRSSARFATVVFGIALCLELAGFFLVAMAASGRPGSYGHAGVVHQGPASTSVSELAATLAPWAIALAVAHVFATLIAMRIAALAVGKAAIAKRVHWVFATLGAATVGVLIARAGLPDALESSLVKLPLGIALAAAGLAGVALYIQTAARLGSVLRVRGETHALPTSTVSREH